MLPQTIREGIALSVMPPPPDKVRIENGELVEDAGLDFKQKVDLATERGKAKLIDDVVAFLNRGNGYLVIGVAEEKGRFRHFEPYRDDPDAYARQLLSIIQDNIDPRPLRVDVTWFEANAGSVFVVHIPWHGRRAFQNRLTGGYTMRTGPKNVILNTPEVRALFTDEDQFIRDAVAFMEREDARCRSRRLMQENGPTFHLAVIPAERYERGREPFDRGHGMLKAGPLYHRGYDAFRGCQDGFEALEPTFDEGRSITRLFIADDWSVYAQVSHPFRTEHGRLTIHEFGQELPAYMAKVADLMREEGLKGPFCVAMALRGLQREGVRWGFPNAEEIAPEPVLVDRLDDPDALRRFHKRVIRSSRYGG